MNNLAEAYQNLGQHCRGRAAPRQGAGNQPPRPGGGGLHRRSTAMNNLAMLYLDQRQFDQGRAAPGQGCWKFCRRRSGRGEPRHAHRHEQPGGACTMDQGELPQGRAAPGQECWKSAAASGGRSTHLTRSMTMNNLAASVLVRTGEAGPLDPPVSRSSVPKFLAQLGTGSSVTRLNAMANLGVSYRDAGRLPEAIALLEQAWELARKQPGSPADPLACRYRHRPGRARTTGPASSPSPSRSTARHSRRPASSTRRRRRRPPMLLVILGRELAQAAEVRRRRAAPPRVPEDPRAERSRTTGRPSTRSPCSAAACWARRSTPRPNRCSWPATRG